MKTLALIAAFATAISLPIASANAGPATAHQNKGSDAVVFQNGRRNSAAINQSGSNSQAVIQQYGSGHVGSIDQTGGNNSAVLMQLGRNTTGHIQQNGGDRGTGDQEQPGSVFGVTVLYGW